MVGRKGRICKHKLGSRKQAVNNAQARTEMRYGFERCPGSVGPGEWLVCRPRGIVSRVSRTCHLHTRQKYQFSRAQPRDRRKALGNRGLKIELRFFSLRRCWCVFFVTTSFWSNTRCILSIDAVLMVKACSDPKGVADPCYFLNFERPDFEIMFQTDKQATVM